MQAKREELSKSTIEKRKDKLDGQDTEEKERNLV